MKRAGNLIEGIAGLENLYLAFWKAKKGKSYSKSVLRYQEKLDENLLILQGEIISGKASVGSYRYFKIYEPKERQICASAFGEQVLHHAMMNVCHPYFEKVQVFDSYASRKGKGVHAALERAKYFTQKYSFFLKLDVRKFFDSIHHEVLKKQIRSLIKDKGVIGVFDQIIDSYQSSPVRGVPIGNLSSQYFANHYLSGLDHFIKETLKIKGYVRYMDDMILWENDKSILKEAKIAIEEYVNTMLKCDLKPILLNTVTRGLPFLGYMIRPNSVKLLQKSKIRFIRKLTFASRQLEKGILSQKEFQNKVLPLISYTSYSDAINFRKSVLLSLKGKIT